MYWYRYRTLSKFEAVIALIVIIIGFIINTFIGVGLCRVSGDSMNPTLSNRDFLLMLKNSTYNRGDIVVIKEGNKNIVKRIIAMPNDKIELWGSDVYVNNEKIIENYINTEEPINYTSLVKELSDDEYFVMGDNRNHSSDSRYYGTYSLSDIKGKIIFNQTNFFISLILFLFILSSAGLIIGGICEKVKDRFFKKSEEKPIDNN